MFYPDFRYVFSGFFNMSCQFRDSGVCQIPYCSKRHQSIPLVCSTASKTSTGSFSSASSTTRPSMNVPLTGL